MLSFSFTIFSLKDDLDISEAQVQKIKESINNQVECLGDEIYDSKNKSIITKIT